MKKAMLFLLIFTCFLMLLSCNKDADQVMSQADLKELAQYSAINIDDSMVESMGLKKDEKVIRVLERSFLVSFTKYDSIEEILKSDIMPDTYYAIVKGTRITRIYEEEEIRLDFTDLKGNRSELSAFLNNSAAEQLPQGANVLDVYFLWDGPSHHGCALYYVTDKGDFVYHESYRANLATGTQQSLFTAREFFDVMRTVRKGELKALGYTDGPNWLPIVIGAGVAVAAGGAVAFFMIRKKKAKAKENA